jgi:hypothetical protein
VIVIIPSRREIRLDYLEPALNAGARVIIVDDSSGMIKIGHPQVEIYNWADKARIAGERIPAFPGLNGACMSFGFYLAWRDSDDDEIILTLGDDCRLDLPDFVNRLEWALSPRDVPVVSAKGQYVNYVELMNDCPPNLFTRGFPYPERIEIGSSVAANPAFNLGCVRSVQDINAIDKIRAKNSIFETADMVAESVLVPKGKLISVSSGTMQFRRRLIPAVYQLPMHFEVAPDWVVSRFGDIWAGFILKRLMDIAGDDMTFGMPWVHHVYPGDVEINIWKEHIGIMVAEAFVELLDICVEGIDPGRYETMLEELVDNFAGNAHLAPPLLRPYLSHLDKAWRAWIACLKDV